MPNPRKTALKLLVRVEKDKAYSNILLDKILAAEDLERRDKRFVSALFYGVLERKITLDAIINCHSKIRLAKLDCEVLQILRMGIYQLLYMDGVPDSAAVNESVKLAKQLKNPSLSGFVNGVLRSFVRDNKKLPPAKDELEKLSLLYSCPLWLIKKWHFEYGEKAMLSLLQSSIGKPPVTVRVNTLKTSESEVTKILLQDGFIVTPTMLANAQEISQGDCQLESSKAYNSGLFHVQDLSSQLCALALGAKEGDTVVDVCSAPGGKAFTVAMQMNNKGVIYACDLHEKRVSLIMQGAKRLGIEIIKAITNDAAKFNADIPQADMVLCDVPCSGLGVIRRKPEIKYKDPADFSRLPEIQYNILEKSSQYLKVGGTLIYSTCTVSKAENDEIVDRFLDKHKNFRGEIISGEIKELNSYKATVIPEYFNSDGFFICKMKRID